MHRPPSTAPTRPALLLRAGAVAAVGFALRLFVFNGSDNAYIVPAMAGFVLPPLAVPFAVAALLPAGRARRVAAWAAVALVWAAGGVFAALFLFYSVLIVGAAAYTLVTGGAGPDGYGVIAAHIGGAMLTVSLVLLLSRRLFPSPGARSG